MWQATCGTTTRCGFNGALGYVTPAAELAGREHEIVVARARNLGAARERTRAARRAAAGRRERSRAFPVAGQPGEIEPAAHRSPEKVGTVGSRGGFSQLERFTNGSHAR